MWKLKSKRIQFIQVDISYTEFLRKNIEQKIPVEHFELSSEMRPFIGILMSHDDIDYIIPLTSPKVKHKKMKNAIDFHKINGGKWGAINFNNMFPILKDPSVYKIIKPVNDGSRYNHLLINQISWLNEVENKQMVMRKAQKLYDSYKNGTLNEKQIKRCCNFEKLEKHYEEYII